jgi:LacI family transcriptional regulator
MSTIDEIASRLKVSTATVSRALNNKPGVSEETRKLVLQLAEDLNYAPNVAARGLATASTNTIGFLGIDRPFPLMADPFYLHVLRGAEEELSRKGYFVIVSTVSPEHLTTAASMQLLREKRVDGLIIPGPFFPPRFIQSIKRTGVPFVLIDNRLEESPADCVLVEDENAGHEATRHLIEHGHQKIVCLSGPNHWASNRARANGYHLAMEEAGLNPVVYHEETSTVESGYQLMLAALEKTPGLTAVFCINDATAMGAIRAIKERGLSVPGDVAVMGVDDVEIAEHYTPPLSTMRVPKRQLGILAARRLIDLLTCCDDYATITMVTTELVRRVSCGCQKEGEG